MNTKELIDHIEAIEECANSDDCPDGILSVIFGLMEKLDGYALVPVDPSEATIQAMRNYWFGTTSALIMTPHDCIELYKKMITDAQEPKE